MKVVADSLTRTSLTTDGAVGKMSPSLLRPKFSSQKRAVLSIGLSSTPGELNGEKMVSESSLSLQDQEFVE